MQQPKLCTIMNLISFICWLLLLQPSVYLQASNHAETSLRFRSDNEHKNGGVRNHKSKYNLRSYYTFAPIWNKNPGGSGDDLPIKFIHSAVIIPAGYKSKPTTSRNDIEPREKMWSFLWPWEWFTTPAPVYWRPTTTKPTTTEPTTEIVKSSIENNQEECEEEYEAESGEKYEAEGEEAGEDEYEEVEEDKSRTTTRKRKRQTRSRRRKKKKTRRPRKKIPG